MSQAQDAFDLVKERGEIRSSAIAELLGCTPTNVHELLLPFVACYLVGCVMERALGLRSLAGDLGFPQSRFARGVRLG